MMQLIFATNNLHKLEEAHAILSNGCEVLSLSDIGCKDILPEDFSTLEENASQKARFIFEKYGKNCFADDTGLEVEALGGKPGAFSARYAGLPADDEKNVAKLLGELKNSQERSARFRTVISLIFEGKEFFFEGIVNGKIAGEPAGKNGFGYDPVFIPDGSGKTFAQMSADEKNRNSHRSRALNGMADFLLKHRNNVIP